MFTFRNINILYILLHSTDKILKYGLIEIESILLVVHYHFKVHLQTYFVGKSFLPRIHTRLREI